MVRRARALDQGATGSVDPLAESLTESNESFLARELQLQQSKALFDASQLVAFLFGKFYFDLMLRLAIRGLDMTKLPQHIEEMRGRLTATATNEQSLVKSLGDALNQVDQQLLRDVRKVANEHVARRAMIFNELQALACSIGVFQPPQEMDAIPQHDGNPYFPAVGDWRQAITSLSYQDEFEAHLNGNGKQH